MVTKEEARLPDTAVTVLWAVIEMILSSAADISAVTGMPAPAVHRSLAVLQKESIVSSVPLGASRRRVARWRLVPAWAERLAVPWHEEWALAHLLARLPLVEWFYPAAAALSPRMGRVKKFLWFRGVSWDAAAQYQGGGWVMFLWSGLLETEAHLQKRLEKMGPHLVDHTMVKRSAPARGPAWPGPALLRGAGPTAARGGLPGGEGLRHRTSGAGVVRRGWLGGRTGDGGGQPAVGEPAGRADGSGRVESGGSPQ